MFSFVFQIKGCENTSHKPVEFVVHDNLNFEDSQENSNNLTSKNIQNNNNTENSPQPLTFPDDKVSYYFDKSSI